MSKNGTVVSVSYPESRRRRKTTPICDTVPQSRGIEVSASVRLEVSMRPTMTGNFWHTPTQLLLMPKAVGTQIQGGGHRVKRRKTSWNYRCPGTVAGGK